MSNVFTIILIAVGYGLWKVLDHFQLPNTFSILLIIFTALSGAVWCYLRFGVLPKRARQIARLEQRSGKPLNDEEKTQIEPISESSEFVASLFPVLAFVLIVRSFIFEPFQIPSSSMEPTLRIGDFILVNKFDYGIKDPVFQNTLIKRGEPQRGDVIVFKAPESPSTDYIKRVVGTPGDRIIYNEANRHLTLVYAKDGKECLTDCETKEFSYTLPQPNENFRFILGRDHSGKVQYGPARVVVGIAHAVAVDVARFQRCAPTAVVVGGRGVAVGVLHARNELVQHAVVGVFVAHALALVVGGLGERGQVAVGVVRHVVHRG